MAGHWRAELTEAVVIRHGNAPMRLLAVFASGLAFYAGTGWLWFWLWPIAYAAVQVLDTEASDRYLAQAQPDGRSTAAVLTTIFLSACVYGSLALPVVHFENSATHAVGLLLLAGGLTNVLIVSRASSAAFIASVTPYAAGLLVYAYKIAEGDAIMTQAAVFTGAFLLLTYVLMAWSLMRRALRAERRARIEVEKRTEEAEAATAAKSAFVAMVSHELRTPLSGILAAGSQLQGQSHTVQGQEAVAVVVDAGRFMHALLDDLLDLAKLEAGKMTTEVIEFDLGHLVWSLERHWGAAAGAAGKPLQLTSAMGIPRLVSGDPTRLRQVLNNLLSNALKFTGPAGVTWTVDVCDGADGCAMTARISDTGPGIAPDKLERLFTAFDQTDSTVARTHGGTGLGLALSRELARVMGGELRVESMVGEGSTFVLSLPLGRVGAERAGAPETEPQAAPEADPQTAEPARSLRVLVVDDHEINRRTMALLLEPAGIEVILTACAEEALAALAFEQVDVVLSDLNMPDMNGFAFTRALRAGNGPNRWTPVVAVTAGDIEAELPGCLLAGMSGCVGKPIDPRRLYAALEDAVADGPSPEVEPEAAAEVA
ncbi:MAG: ATP-binding protein [Pseudomonadota bacterium]|nr:ATP-binding protein [Pseudomonadota bacterium]